MVEHPFVARIWRFLACEGWDRVRGGRLYQYLQCKHCSDSCDCMCLPILLLSTYSISITIWLSMYGTSAGMYQVCAEHHSV
jgi:hypothetical protein